MRGTVATQTSSSQYSLFSSTIVCPKKVGKGSDQKKTSPRNIRVEENTLTFLGPACFVYHIWSCQGQRQK